MLDNKIISPASSRRSNKADRNTKCNVRTCTCCGLFVRACVRGCNLCVRVCLCMRVCTCACVCAFAGVWDLWMHARMILYLNMTIQVSFSFVVLAKREPLYGVSRTSHYNRKHLNRQVIWRRLRASHSKRIYKYLRQSNQCICLVRRTGNINL